ncbi:MAG: radical SAM protein [Elusimicrobia bacterium]|nr:radical SAM protein [Elusimicrobiota bacterium]
MFPRLRDGVILRRRLAAFYGQPSDRVAVGPAGRVFELEDDSFEFLKACDGRSDFPALQARFPDLLDASASPRRLARELASDPALRELVEVAAEPNPSDPRQVVETPGLAAACRVCVWHLVSVCDLSCKHCYLGGQARRRPFTEASALATARNLHAVGVEGVRLSGGEATLRPSLLRRTAAALAEHCLPFSINSNAAGDVSVIRELFASHPAYARFVQVSVDGPAEAHDSLRGRKGAFDASMRNISRLVKAGVPVTVVSMMHRGWLGREAELFDRLAESGIRHWAVELPVAAGRWSGGKDPLALDQDGVRAMSLALISRARSRPKAYSVFEINQVFRRPAEADEVQKDLSSPVCLHHLGLLTIDEAGLSFCSIFGKAFGRRLTEFAASDCGPSSFLAAWNRIARARVGHRLRDNPACRTCRLFSACQGGCPGHYAHPARFSGCDRHARMLAEVRLSVGRSLRSRRRA